MTKKMLAAGLAGAALGTALMFASAASAAQDGPRMGRDPMSRADTNSDGTVTRDELLANVEKHFTKLDTNRDGKISAEERKAMGGMRGRMARRAMERRGMDGERAERGLARADTDKDGAISLAEQRAMALRRFDYVDRNGDGKADQAEREALRDMMAGMRGHGRHGPPPAGAPKAPDSQ